MKEKKEKEKKNRKKDKENGSGSGEAGNHNDIDAPDAVVRDTHEHFITVICNQYIEVYVCGDCVGW